MTGRDSTVRLPSWLIAASLAVVVIATLTYFITTNNDNTDEAAPPENKAATSSSTPTDQQSAAADKDDEKKSEESKKPEKGATGKNGKKSDRPKDIGGPKKSDAPAKKKQQTEEPTITADATVDVYNNAGITNLAASVSADVRAAGFAIGGVDNWYGAIPSTTVYYPPGLEEQAELLADTLGVGRIMPAVDPMSSERLSLILTAAI